MKRYRMTGILNNFSRTQAGMVDGAKNAETAADNVTNKDIEYNPFPYFPDRLIFRSNVILEQALQEEPEDGEQQGREIVESLAILYLQDGQSGGKDQDSSHDGKFIYKGALEDGA